MTDRKDRAKHSGTRPKIVERKIAAAIGFASGGNTQAARAVADAIDVMIRGGWRATARKLAIASTLPSGGSERPVGASVPRPRVASPV
jgi:hypothetical protein